jgi:hypothetical protein
VDLGASPEDTLALVWAQQQDSSSDVMIEMGDTSDRGAIIWSAPINLSNTERLSEDPHVAVATDGLAHVIWREGEPSDFRVQYATCELGECSAPIALRGAVCTSIPEFDSSSSAYPMDIAANPDGSVMAIWMDASGGLQYQVLPGTDSSLQTDAGCITLPEGQQVGTFSMSAAPLGFAVAYDEGAVDGSQVWSMEYDADGWTRSDQAIEEGILPDIWVSEAGDQLIAWCVDGAGVQVLHDGVSETVSDLSCAGKPVIAQDENGNMHIIWYSTQVEDALGQTRESDVLYESILLDSGWSRPAIVAALEGSGDYALDQDGSGLLHLAWQTAGVDPDLNYAQQGQYACDEVGLEGVEKVLYEIARSGGYRLPGLLPASAPPPSVLHPFRRRGYHPGEKQRFGFPPGQPTPPVSQASASTPSDWDRTRRCGS